MQKEEKGILAVVKREIGRMISRPIYIVMILIIPILSYSYFITLLNQGLPDKMPIAVVDHDNSSTSRLLIRQLDATQQCKIVGKYGSYHEALEQMQNGTVYAFVEIPIDFQTDILAGRQPNVEFYTQSVYFVAGSLLMKDLNVTIGTVAGGINLKTRLAKGQTAEYAMSQINPIASSIQEMGNSWTNYSVYLSTTMLPGILQLMILIVTVFVLGVELKEKTSRRWLITADKSLFKAIIGKLLPYSVLFILVAYFGNIIMFDYLQFPFSGSSWQMGLGVVLFVLAQQGLGTFIISLVPSLRDALSITAILGTLAVTFSGLTFPVEGMMQGIGAWNVAFPLRHYFLIYVSQALSGGGIAASWMHYLALMVFIILPIFAGLRLKKALIHQNYPID